MLQGMLESYKVLDLVDQKGMFCGYILAQLGAQVLAVELPGGSSARALAPFAGDRNGPDVSLWWQAYGRGKSILALDLNSERGSAKLLELVVEASRIRLSRTPAQVSRAGPELGEHNLRVLEEILGYDSERIAAGLASGAMG